MKKMDSWNVKLWLGVVFVVVLVNGVQCAPYAMEKKLVTDLLANYSAGITPRNSTDQPVIVYMNFYLIALADFDVVNEVLETTGYCGIYWNDPNMKWDTPTYNNILQTTIPTESLWKPDMALRNSVSDYKVLGDKAMYLQVYSTGWVYWYPYQRFDTSCSVDVTYFPFDVQHCFLHFSAWSFESNQVSLMLYPPQLYTDMYTGHPIWDLVETKKTLDNSTVSSLKFHLTLRRKPQSFLLSVIVPTILLSVLNLFVFVLPCESGERAGYSITVFLSFIVFFTIVTAMLPENSDSNPILGIFILIQTTMSTVICAVSLTLMRLYFCFDYVEVPAILLKMARIIRWKPCRKSNSRCCSRSKIQAFDDEKAMTGKISRKTTDLNQQLADEKDTQAEEKHDWKYMVNSLDILMFYLTLLVLIITSGVCFKMAMSGPVR